MDLPSIYAQAPSPSLSRLNHLKPSPPHPQALHRSHELEYGADGQTDRRAAKSAAACALLCVRLLSAAPQLGALARFQDGEDEHGEEGGEELGDCGEDVVDAEVDACHGVVVG